MEFSSPYHTLHMHYMQQDLPHDVFNTTPTFGTHITTYEADLSHDGFLMMKQAIMEEMISEAVLVDDMDECKGV